MLDQPSNKLGGMPFRHGTDNNLVLRVMKEPRVANVHKIIANDIKQGTNYDGMHRNNRTGFDAITKVLMQNLNLKDAEPRKVFANSDAFGFDISGVDGAAFFLFAESEIEPSPITER